MGKPLRSGGSGTVAVNVRPQIKTCPAEVGIGQLNLPDGTQIVALGHAFYPSHDRPLVDMVKRLLADVRPEVVMCLGGMAHEEAFKLLCDEEDIASDLTKVELPPELAEIKEAHANIEKRFLMLAKMNGRFIADFAKASGGHVYYIPSISRPLPNEIEAHLYCIEKHRVWKAWAERHPDEAKVGPEIPKDYATFLGLNGHKQVTVMNYGSAIVVNGSVLFMIGDYRRMYPGTSAWRDVQKNSLSVVRSFDGKVFSGWKTTPVHTQPRSQRKYWQAHEVGNLFSLKDGLGYLRDYEWRSQSIWYGVVAGGKVFGFNIPVLTGADGRRTLMLNGVAYDEDAASCPAKLIALPTPESCEALTASAKAAASAKATKTTKTTSRKATKPAVKKSPRRSK